MADGQGELERAMKRMGDPSWWILSVLDPYAAVPGIEILGRVAERLEQGGYPVRELDPSTLHYALRRMIEDGLVRDEGRRVVSVPGPRKTTRQDSRSVYTVTALGCRARQLRWQVERSMSGGTTWAHGGRLTGAVMP